MSEPIKDAWVKEAKTVIKPIIQVPEHRAYVLHMEDVKGKQSIYNSVYKMLFCRKSQGDPIKLKWCLAAANDASGPAERR